MKKMEEYIAQERYSTDSRDNARTKLRNDRQLTREQRKQRYRRAYIASVIAWAVLITALLAYNLLGDNGEAVDTPETVEPTEATSEAVEDDIEPEQQIEEADTPEVAVVEPEEPEDFENEKIEAALLEQGYFRDDIPLDFDTQDALRAACEETGVPFELALAVIRKETDYRNIKGDSGRSYGYMQVQPKWHQDRMDKLGVTDLMDPYGNFRVGCDFLAELMSRYSVEEALTAYNSGKPGSSRYAKTVMKYWSELQ